MAYRKYQFKRFGESMPSKNIAKVNFSQHFSKDFFCPYGSATEQTIASDSDFRRKLQPFTCEWLCRPLVAASKLAATLNKNLEKLNDVKLLSNATEHLDKMKKKLHSVSKGWFVTFHLLHSQYISIYSTCYKSISFFSYEENACFSREQNCKHKICQKSDEPIGKVFGDR